MVSKQKMLLGVTFTIVLFSNAYGQAANWSTPQVTGTQAAKDLDATKMTESMTAAYAHSEAVPEAGLYTVERVIDGDTIVVTTPQGKSETVRLIGIEAPEIEPTEKFVKSLGLEGKKVRLEFDVQGKDKEGRLLAYVYGKPTQEVCDTLNMRSVDGRIWTDVSSNCEYFLNLHILLSGYATPKSIPPNVKYADACTELYKDAVKHKRGLWNVTCEREVDCQFLECSNYDNPIKTGYRHDCVDGQCKCMCYGCM